MSAEEIEKLYKLWFNAKASKSNYKLTSVLLQFLNETNVTVGSVTNITFY